MAAEVADLLRADANEVHEEMVEYAQRRLHLRNELFDVPMMRPEDVLSPREMDALWVYSGKWHDLGPQRCEARNFVAHLGDNPDVMLVWSGRDGKVPTIPRSSGFLWAVAQGR